MTQDDNDKQGRRPLQQGSNRSSLYIGLIGGDTIEDERDARRSLRNLALKFEAAFDDQYMDCDCASVKREWQGSYTGIVITDEYYGPALKTLLTQLLPEFIGGVRNCSFFIKWGERDVWPLADE
jgi:hypothetical protein